ncbi:hemocyanin [Folsomia candida]|uniref:Hemocyanin n=1 Tax=Folsomia candida TaxID=158441 RepID=A0A226D612_FOLCA|nr:hemocyanin [Folsomia candida]OXA40985.1 Hemocyanin [Folsomia candida]
MRHDMCVVLVFICLSILVNSLPTNKDSNFASDQLLQHKISSLFNFFCARNPDQHAAKVSTFDPLNYLSLYTNPDTVSKFVTALQQNLTSPRWGPYLSDKERIDTIPMFDILYFIDTSTPQGFDLFYNTTAYFSLRANVRQFIMAMELISSTKFFGRLTLPPFSTSVPQFFSPKSVLWGINDVVKPHLGEGEHVEEDGGDKLTGAVGKDPTYWKFDAGYREFHFAWNMDLPPDLVQDKYQIRFDRKGELFLYSHHYMEVRYWAELRSQNLPDIETLTLNKTFKVTQGYSPFFLMADFSVFPVRGPGDSLTTQDNFQNLTIWEDIILQSLADGYAVGKSRERYPYHQPNETDASDIAGTDAFGALFQSTTASVNIDLYGNLHESLHLNLAHLRDPRFPTKLPKDVMGVMDHAESSVTDSAFYQIHYYVDNLYKKHKYYSPQIRNEQNMAYPGITVRQVGLNSSQHVTQLKTEKFPVLTTYFEYYSYNVTNAVIDCQKLESGKEYVISRKRLNYNKFEYNFDIFSSHGGNEDAIVRVFMGPYIAADGKPYPIDDFYWNMIEMDKFPVVIEPGENRITRASSDSSILKKDVIAPGELKRNCGWPSNLLLPKGNPEGLHMKLFVIVTPAKERHGVKLTVQNAAEFPAFSLCGHPYSYLPDDKPMGFPFDKRMHLDNPFGSVGKSNFMFYDVTIKHLISL